MFSRRFVKSFPALSTGFEIETELAVHALELRMPVIEVATPYKERLDGSASKLSTVRDGLRIMRTVARLFKEERPLAFFTYLGLLFVGLSLIFGVPVILEYVNTGLVTRMPTALLSTSLMLLAVIWMVCGAILDTVTRGRRELRRLHYLQCSNESS